MFWLHLLDLTMIESYFWHLLRTICETICTVILLFVVVFVFIFLVLNFEIKKDNIERPYIALENDLSKKLHLFAFLPKNIEKTHRRKQNIEEG